MPLRILIVDDEAPARQRLGTLVKEMGHVVCAEAADSLAAEEALRRSQPDVVLLDIAMPGPNGLVLAERIEREYAETPVVLVTAHAAHAISAYEHGVLDYLLKPVRPERLARALSRVEGRRPSPSLRLNMGRRNRLVSLNDIDCLVSEEGYVFARSKSVEGFVDGPLSELETRLGPYLLRIHRACLVVKSAIAGIEVRAGNDHRILFRDGLEPAPISRRRLQAVQYFLREQGEQVRS